MGNERFYQSFVFFFFLIMVREAIAMQYKSNTLKQAWQLPPSDYVVQDPLLTCLVILTRLEHKPFSPETLIAGLPLVDNQLTPALFIRAARRAGLSAQLVKRSLENISSLPWM